MRSTKPNETARRGAHRLLVALFAGALILLTSVEVLARVGGGQGYGGGGGSGGDGDGGFVVWIVYELVRFLVYLTIEYPIIGIPLDILVILAVVYYFTRRTRKGPSSFSASSSTLGLGAAGTQRQTNVAGRFAPVGRLVPN